MHHHDHNHHQHNPNQQQHHNHNQHQHNHQHQHHHHNAGHRNEPRNVGSDMCLVESREIENFSDIDRAVIANRVWDTCKPAGKFMPEAPTVSARRVKLMRVHLLSETPQKDCDVEMAEQQGQANQNLQGDREREREQRSLLNTVKSLAAALIYPVPDARNNNMQGGQNQCAED